MRSKGFATLRNASKLTFFDKIGRTKSVGFRFYSAISRSESRFEISRDHFDFFDLVFNFFGEERVFILAFTGFEPTHCVTRQIRGDSKLRD